MEEIMKIIISLHRRDQEISGKPKRFTDTGETMFHHVPRTEGTKVYSDTFGIGYLHVSRGLET